MHELNMKWEAIWAKKIPPSPALLPIKVLPEATSLAFWVSIKTPLNVPAELFTNIEFAKVVWVLDSSNKTPPDNAEQLLKVDPLIIALPEPNNEATPPESAEWIP